MRSRLGTSRFLLLLAVLSMLVTACLGEGGGGGGGGGEGGGGGGGGVEIFGAFTADEANRFDEALAAFNEESGANATYNGSTDFNTLVTTRVEGGDIPDIALFPQPGLLLQIAESADALPLDEYLDTAALEETLIPGFLDAATAEDGTVYGFPMRMAVKSVLWYPVPEFEEAGYAIPETDTDLTALMDQIKADGGTPWCLGMEAADATGWVGTDWIEEYMLRLHGPEVYDQWVTNEVKFDSPEVRAAFEKFQELWGDDANIVGGKQGVLSIEMGQSSAPLFDEPPGCWLHRQGNFITGFFPDEVQENLDQNVGAAYFPPAEGGYDGNPVLAGGDLALLLNDTPEAREVMEWLATPESLTPWAEAGGWLSPHRTFDTSVYPTEVERSLGEIGAQADVLRFDASDLMPGAVGAGTFWRGIVNWIGGQRSLDDVLTEIDASFPAGGGTEG